MSNNIYVASFNPSDSDYEVDTYHYNNWWYTGDSEQGYHALYKKIKKCSILRFIIRRTNGYNILGYLIAKEDYIIDQDNPNTEEIRKVLSVPYDNQVGTNPTYKIDLRKADSTCIWTSVLPEYYNAYACEEAPYTFVTEGILTDYISLQWNDRYYEPGSFSLVLPSSQEAMDLLKEGRYLLSGKSDRIMIIDKVQFNNNLRSDGHIMQVYGRSIESILERRVAFPGQGLNSNVYKGTNGMTKAIYDLVDHFFIHPEEIAQESADGQKMFYYPERKVPFIILPPEEERYTNIYIKRPFRASVNKIVSKDNLLKIISELCKNEQLGFKIVPEYRMENSTNCILWKFILYTGKDKSYSRTNKEDPLLLFSPVLGNVEAVATTKDLTNYRNVIFCGKEKESDGFINLNTNTSEALDYKTGIEIVDKFNSGATTLITGVKNQLATKLENSEIAYTGVLFMAVAASLKDKDYQATVTSIEEVGKVITKLYVDVTNNEDMYANSENTMKLKVRIKKTEDIIGNIASQIGIGSNYKDDYLSFILSGPIVEENGNKYREMFLLPSYGEKPDLLGFYGGQGGLNKYFIDENQCPVLSVNYRSESGNTIGEIIANGDNGDSTITFPLYDYNNEIINIVSVKLFVKDSTDPSNPIQITSYPSDYISKSRADNIKITFRHAFGDKDTSSSKKTSFFMLSDVSSLSNSTEGFTFKTSTECGWLTTPILKQAISDLNNTTFAKLSIVKKSAIQAWFKTFDKYTQSNSQMRWLCQEYKYDSENVGIDRREVFVDEDSSESDEWNASAINSFQSSTVTIAVDQQEDEESDEKINERLLESARKKSGEYRKKRDVDASLELEMYKYMSQDQNGYDLGDIIQVDDGWNNLDQFYITGVNITNDTSSGPKVIPTFERFEEIPKEYRRIDYLQVANMILPAKFNRRFSGESDADELDLPSNMYFADEEVGPISSIKSESIGVITDIECDLQYVKKTSISGEEVQDLSPVFALISAIGSEKRKPIDNQKSINMPFVLLSSTYKSPYFFMTGYDSENQIGENRYIYLYIDNRGLEYDYKKSTFGLKKWYYRSGIGYKNINILSDSIINENTISNFIYRQLDNGDLHKYVINKLYKDKSRYTNVNNIVVEDENSVQYYSKAYIDYESNLLNDRPLARAWYKSGVIFNHQTSETAKIYGENVLRSFDELPLKEICFVDSSTRIVNNNISLKYSSNCLSDKLPRSLSPINDNSKIQVDIDKTYWGQDNYRLPQNEDTTDENDVEREYQDYLYENHIVLGGAAFYGKAQNDDDYKLKFYDINSSGNVYLVDKSPKACDTNNGVRITGSIKVYETLSSTRQIYFKDDKKSFYAPNNDETYTRYWGKPIVVIHNKIISNNFFNPSNDVLAYYPDLTTRKLVHEYVPVVYTEGGNDIPKEEKYGLYDIIDKIFVPINWGDNEDATFIEAGGEINNE